MEDQNEKLMKAEKWGSLGPLYFFASLFVFQIIMAILNLVGVIT